MMICEHKIPIAIIEIAQEKKNAGKADADTCREIPAFYCCQFIKQMRTHWRLA